MTTFSFAFGFCRTRIRATLTLLAGLLYCATLLAESRQILVIESYHAEYPWDQSYLAGLRDKLPGYQIHTFEMDTKRLPKSEFDTQAEKAWRRFEEIRPELVVLGDDNAVKLEFLARIKSGEASTADLKAACDWLKTNDISGVAFEGSPLDKLANIMPTVDPELVQRKLYGPKV